MDEKKAPGFEGGEAKAKIDLISSAAVCIAVLFLMLFTVWHMMDLVLLTFIISFIFYHIVELIQRRYCKALHVPDGLLLSLAYLIFIGLLVIISNELMPKLIEQVTWLANEFMNFDVNAVMAVLDPRIASAIAHIDFNTYLNTAGGMIASLTVRAGSFAVDFFLSLLLSFIILLEKGQIKQFGENMANSRIAFVYKYFVIFGGNFCKTFGKVMFVQVIIATVNCLISMVGLKLIGFSSVLGLGVMIFCLGLIPVAGVIISLIPLCLIAFSFGGVIKVLEVLLMIMIIHAIEAYILNPKLMSSKTRLPVCFTFIILLVGEHYLGVWGLLIGVPIFIFLMGAFGVDYQVAKKEAEIKVKKRSKKKRD